MILDPRAIDITGQQFGRWTVVNAHSRRRRPGGGRVTVWLCKCSCGADGTVDGQELRKGKSQSCGCRQREIVGAMARTVMRKHGMYLMPEYHVWRAMLQRCGNPNAQEYHRYGARGISVCGRWKEFSNFIEDMGRRPSAELSLDRINNDGNYEPGNCRWATREQQNSNKRPRKSRKAA